MRLRGGSAGDAWMSGVRTAQFGHSCDLGKWQSQMPSRGPFPAGRAHSAGHQSMRVHVQDRPTMRDCAPLPNCTFQESALQQRASLNRSEKCDSRNSRIPIESVARRDCMSPPFSTNQLRDRPGSIERLRTERPGTNRFGKLLSERRPADAQQESCPPTLRSTGHHSNVHTTHFERDHNLGVAHTATINGGDKNWPKEPVASTRTAPILHPPRVNR